MSNQYRSILKATSIFGGTQLIQILITFVRSKFVALFIGAEGMGLSAMYNSTITLFVTICGLGIGTSVVRDLAKAKEQGDEVAVAQITKIFTRLLWILAITGSIIIVIMSKYLSIWTFDSIDYQKEFIALSLMLMFTLLQNGNISLLVGMRRVKDSAMCSLLGSIVMLVTSVPFFYFFDTSGIVPGLVLSSFANYIISLIYFSKINFQEVNIDRLQAKKYIKSIITLGVAMVASLLLGNLTRYLTNIAITRLGNIADIGYYNAAISITFQSISLVFAAMASDYLPRLSSSINNNDLMNSTVKQQTEIILYMVIPILLFMMVASPLIVKILLTDDFLVINQFIRIITLGMFLKAASYPLGYIAFAKGDKKVYFWLEGVYANFSSLLFSIGFYYFWGLQGMAWAMVISYVLYYFIVNLIAAKRYELIVNYDTIKVILVVAFTLLGVYLLSNILEELYYLLISIVIFLVFSYFSLKKLNDRTQFVSVFKEKIKRR